jgi:hypothetical protein
MSADGSGDTRRIVVGPLRNKSLLLTFWGTFLNGWRGLSWRLFYSTRLRGQLMGWMHNYFHYKENRIRPSLHIFMATVQKWGGSTTLGANDLRRISMNSEYRFILLF